MGAFVLGYTNRIHRVGFFGCLSGRAGRSKLSHESLDEHFRPIQRLKNPPQFPLK
jgi:hypothetical protein